MAHEQSPSAPNGYDSHFFKALHPGGRQSAQVMVPLVLEWCHPSSVVDVGCGDGTWLSVFQEQGVQDILGIDGEYVNQSELQIPDASFMAADLQEALTLDRTFDLVVSLEVAEHLFALYADRFVESLVKLGDVVLFSAAIPHQGGTHHVNERWPAYWVERFEQQGYVAIDALRKLIWDYPQVEPWYAQNCLIFVKGDRLADYPVLQAQVTSQTPLALVHPKIYLQHCPNFPELTKEIEILAVSMLPSATLPSGSALAIAVKYQWYSQDDAALLSISISNPDGQIYLDTHTSLTKPQDATTIQTLQLHIDRLDLMPGNYFVNVGLYSQGWAVTHDFHWHLYPLSLISDVCGQGLLHPPMSWQLPT
jgi:SAM-dependent methyltransferase